MGLIITRGKILLTNLFGSCVVDKFATSVEAWYTICNKLSAPNRVLPSKWTMAANVKLTNSVYFTLLKATPQVALVRQAALMIQLGLVNREWHLATLRSCGKYSNSIESQFYTVGVLCNSWMLHTFGICVLEASDEGWNNQNDNSHWAHIIRVRCRQW